MTESSPRRAVRTIPIAAAWSESVAETAARIRHLPPDEMEYVLGELLYWKGRFIYEEVCEAL